jgi:drug/metabolite transporter (DMT)-like permease
MSDYDNESARSRPEVVNETVVVVADSRQLGGKAWGLVLAVGIVAAVFGIIVLANIWGSVHLVAIFAGLFLLFAGILQLFVGGGSRTGRIVAGIIAIVAGVALIAWPEASVKTVAVIVGLSFLIWGVAVAVAAIAARGEGYGVVVGFGFILAIVGLVFIIWPGPTVTLLMILVGLASLLFGISAIVQALALRRASRGT